MIGQMWQIVLYHIIQITKILMMGFCFCRLAAPFLENKKGAVCSGAVCVLTMLFLFLGPPFLSAYLAHGMGTGAAFICICLMDRRNYEQKIFLSVTFFSLLWLTDSMAEIIYDSLYSIAGNTDFMKQHLHLWPALFVLVCLIYLLLASGFLMAAIACILRTYHYKEADMTKKELLMLSVPSVAGMAGYAVMQDYRWFYLEEKGTNSYRHDILAVLYYTVSVFSIIIVVALYQAIKAKQEEKLLNELYLAQADSMMKHIAQVENLYQNIRGIRHDMANHILTLERLYAAGQTKEAEVYCLDLKKHFKKTAGETKTGNPITDVIIQESKKEAESSGIRFQTEFYYPNGSHISVFDMSIILNNALQNAMEHAVKCERPYIFLSSWRRNNAYMIEVRNSFTGQLRWKKESGLPVTEKEEAEGHGYGLSNIRKAAGKYGGDIGIVQQDGEFCLSVMLMLE